MAVFKQPWGGQESAPSRGIAFSPGVLVRATQIIGKDELTVPRLAEELPPTPDAASGAFGKLGDDLPAAVARILLASRAVAHLASRIGPGTGFMITPTLLMTNNHVFVGETNSRVATTADADAVVKFNYHQDVNGKFAQVKEYKTAPDAFFAASVELDYAVVAVEGDPGKEWGTITVPNPAVTVEVDDDVFIIQHPEGGPKQVAMAGNEVAYVDDTVIQYTADTLPGSSGSPVFDWQWRLVALHHAGGDLVEPQTGDRYFRNEGIRMDAIRAALSVPGGPPELGG